MEKIIKKYTTDFGEDVELLDLRTISLDSSLEEAEEIKAWFDSAQIKD